MESEDTRFRKFVKIRTIRALVADAFYATELIILAVEAMWTVYICYGGAQPVVIGVFPLDGIIPLANGFALVGGFILNLQFLQSWVKTLLSLIVVSPDSY